MNIEMSRGLIQKAISNEMLSAHSYWVAAYSCHGKGREDVFQHFLEHRQEELDHADALAERLGVLGFAPVNDPALWHLDAGQWSPIESDDATVILEELASEETAAIDLYRDAYSRLKSDDVVTADLMKSILATEEEHLHELNELYRGLMLVEPKQVMDLDDGDIMDIEDELVAK